MSLFHIQQVPRFVLSFGVTSVLLAVTTDSLALGPPLHAEHRTGLRSELWQMEYQQDETAAEHPEPAVDSDAAGTPPTETAGDARTDPEQSVADRSTTNCRLPGEPQAEQLADETPLAEWQLDQAAQPAGGATVLPTDWQISRAQGFNRHGRGTAVNGPSAVTFAVAIVAGIVVTGALCTGRE